MDWLLSKLAIAIGLVMSGLGLWVWGKRQQAKRQEAEARAEVAEKTTETLKEQEKRHEKVSSANPDQLVDYWRRPAE